MVGLSSDVVPRKEMKPIDIDGDGIPDEWEQIPFPEENALLSDISERQRLFHLAADKYEKMEARVSIPTLLITSLSGLLSFMGGTPLFSTQQKTLIAVITGVLATVATVLGTMSRSFNLSTKKELFAVTSASYRVVCSKIRFKIRELERNRGKTPTVKEVEDAARHEAEQMGKSPEEVLLEVIKARSAEEARIKAEKTQHETWWAQLKDEVLDIQKNLSYYPTVAAIELWKEEGLLGKDEKSTGEMPGTLNDNAQLKEKLRVMGVVQESDLAFLSDEDIAELGVSKVDARKLQYYARVNAAKSKGLDRKTQKKANKFTGALDTGLQRTLSASNSLRAMFSGSKGVVPVDASWPPTASPAAAAVVAASGSGSERSPAAATVTAASPLTSPNLTLPGPSNPLSRSKLPALET